VGTPITGDRGGTTSLLGLRWILRALSRVARPSPRGYLVVAAAALYTMLSARRAAQGGDGSVVESHSMEESTRCAGTTPDTGSTTLGQADADAHAHHG